MGDVSTHFNRAEFVCPCGLCKPAAVDIYLIEILEAVRSYFKSEVKITSGWRCKQHNNDIGGASQSKHLEGIAADIKVKGRAAIEVYEFLDAVYPNELGLGKYRTWVHIDVRKKRRGGENELV